MKEISKLRKSLGIRQKELASVCGVSQSYIARLEKGDINPTYENIRKIYNYLESHTRKTDKMDMEASKIMSVNVIHCSSTDSVLSSMETLKKLGISQMPVLNGDGRVIGTVGEVEINEFLMRGISPESLKKMIVSRIMGPALPQLPPNTPISAIYPILRFSNAVLIMDKLELKGIITKADILKAVESYAEPSI
ncbi:MAG: CBS domain-containing protein [Cuniculiplasma sp.]